MSSCTYCTLLWPTNVCMQIVDNLDLTDSPSHNLSTVGQCQEDICLHLCHLEPCNSGHFVVLQVTPLGWVDQIPATLDLLHPHTSIHPVIQLPGARHEETTPAWFVIKFPLMNKLNRGDSTNTSHEAHMLQEKADCRAFSLAHISLLSINSASG